MLLILNPDYRDHANAFIKGIIKKRGIHAPGPDLNYMAGVKSTQLTKYYSESSLFQTSRARAGPKNKQV